MATRVYLDTNILRLLVSPKPSERSEARSEISRLSNPSFETIIPQVVLGEALATIIRDYTDPHEAYTTLKDLCDRISQKMNVTPSKSFPPIRMNILEEAKRLKEHEQHISDTDITIVAQALLDSNSQMLFTLDRKILDSSKIKDEEKRLRDAGKRKERLKIVDGLK